MFGVLQITHFPLFQIVHFSNSHFVTDSFDKHNMWTIKNKSLYLV